jgi:hypothetical protein
VFFFHWTPDRLSATMLSILARRLLDEIPTAVAAAVAALDVRLANVCEDLAVDPEAFKLPTPALPFPFAFRLLSLS